MAKTHFPTALCSCSYFVVTLCAPTLLQSSDIIIGKSFQRGISLSILSPRKIPALFRLFEKAGGDLTASQTKNYAKDPRHLVLLKGFRLLLFFNIFKAFYLN